MNPIDRAGPDAARPGAERFGAARARLAALAFARDSLLCREARSFSTARQDLFLATYMAMRLIDDHVDHLVDVDRGWQSPALGAIDGWQRRVQAAVDGRIEPGAEGYEEAVLVLLAGTVPPSPLDGRAFDALARAMRRDALGQPLRSWQDFLDYAEGATVAPTFVFLTLLALDGEARRLPARLRLERLWQRARPMAVYCYLVHIVRDLAKDAAAGPHLLTIPGELFADLCADRQALARAILQGDQPVTGPLARRLLKRLHTLEPEVAAACLAIQPQLSPESRASLGRIIEHYGDRARQIAVQSSMAGPAAGIR